MSLRYFVVDAFADRPFRGNPAAVVPLVRWLPDELMQSIANELSLSETAFFCEEAGGLRLRWFTPVLEVDLCGHATLASAAVLMTQLEPTRTQVAFVSRSGELRVSREDDRFVLDFPSWPARPVEEPDLRAQVTAALGAAPRELHRSRDLFAVFDTAEQVRALTPDFAAIKRIDVHAICATAPGPAGGPDFVSRFFTPRQGIDEDPVTGSAHCTLTPLWAEKLGKTSMTAHQVSRRGGVLDVRLAGDRVAIGGRAVMVASGSLLL